MSDLRTWPKRNPSTPTGRFIIPTGCKCMHCDPSVPWRKLMIVASAIAACLMLSLSGCATVKADAKDVAAVCRPELLGDAVQILPLVAALAICEAQGQDCSVTISQLEADGKADAQACALAQLHAATVKLSATPDAGTH